MFQNTPAQMTQDEAAALTHELVAARPDWRPATIMAALARVRGTLDREQITNAAWVAAASPDVTDFADAFKPNPGPFLPPAPPSTIASYEQDVYPLDLIPQREIDRLVHTLPHCFEELAAEDIVAHQYDRGVRRLNLEDGGPTYALRLLIDDLRGGQATAHDLDAALNVLETQLCIPLTTADDGS